MPRIDIDLGRFAATRGELEQLATQQRSADAEVTIAKRALESAVRAGADPTNTASLRDRLAAVLAARGNIVERRRIPRAMAATPERAMAASLDRPARKVNRRPPASQDRRP